MSKENKLVAYDYEGARISFRQGDDVMVNATEMARYFNKRPAEWLRLPSTQDYITALTEVGKSHIGEIQTIKGGVEGGGSTWMHSNLALEFARWLSPKFGIWCNDRILELMANGEVKIETQRKKVPSKTRVDAVMAAIRGASELFSLDATSQQRMYNDFAKDYDLPLVDYVAAPNGGRDSLTNLLKKHGISMSAQEANKRLMDAGLLRSEEYAKHGGKVGHYYVVTEKGKEFGDNFQDEHSPKRTQPLWYTEKFTALVQLFQPALA